MYDIQATNAHQYNQWCNATNANRCKPMQINAGRAGGTNATNAPNANKCSSLFTYLRGWDPYNQLILCETCAVTARAAR